MCSPRVTHEYPCRSSAASSTEAARSSCGRVYESKAHTTLCRSHSALFLSNDIVDLYAADRRARLTSCIKASRLHLEVQVEVVPWSFLSFEKCCTLKRFCFTILNAFLKPHSHQISSKSWSEKQVLQPSHSMPSLCTTSLAPILDTQVSRVSFVVVLDRNGLDNLRSNADTECRLDSACHNCTWVLPHSIQSDIRERQWGTSPQFECSSKFT